MTPDSEHDARAEFLASMDELRPALHRYCSGMTGSVLDGEDMVQETLATAYFKLPLYREHRSLRGWIFRIAHNKCVDLLRARGRWNEGEMTPREEEQLSDSVEAAAHRRQDVRAALTQMVRNLAPKERASLLLKDVLGYSLAETAEIVESTPGGVKAALHRGRTKLANDPGTDAHDDTRNWSESERELLLEYVDRFNRQDWNRLEELLADDARLEVVDRYIGTSRDAIARNYFTQYARMDPAMRLSLGLLDGEPVLISWLDTPEPSPVAAIRVRIDDRQVTTLTDYLHVHYLLDSGRLESDPRTR